MPNLDFQTMFHIAFLNLLNILTIIRSKRVLEMDLLTLTDNFLKHQRVF